MNAITEASDGLGKFLRSLRSSRQVSLSSVAEKAGIAKSTLSKWETGRFLPRLPEIDAVLTALEASPAERRQTLQLIDAPRALIHLRQTDRSIANEADMDLGGAPAGGDLLRAMRMRRGQSVDQVAYALGVSGRSIRAWERSDAWPTTEHLHALCFLLGAAEEELSALLSAGPWLPTTISASEAAIEQHLHNLVFSHYDSRAEALRDLSYLSLEAAIVARAAQQRSARLFLAQVYSYYALWLGDNERYRESARYAERVLALGRREALPSDLSLRAAIALARSRVFAGEQGVTATLAARGSALLSPFLAQGKTLGAHYEAWGLQELAGFLTLEGKIEVGLDLSARAVAISQHSDNPSEFYLRRFDCADLLIKAGQADEALAILPISDPFGPEHPRGLMREALIQIRTFLLTKNLSEAQDCLRNAYVLARTYGLDTTEADAIATQF